MKIAFIGGRDIHTLGGIENYMLNLATQLVILGHEPIVFCESEHNGEEIVNGFRVIHQKGPKNNLICKPWLGLKSTLFTIRKLKNVDMIHYNAWPPSLWSPLARVFGIRTLMQGHGLEWQRSKYSAPARRIMKLMEWFTAHLNRDLIMCSQDQCRYFKEHYNRDSVCIPTAINIPNSHNDTNICKKFGLEDKKYFLFLARLVQDKNPDYLIKAFKNVAPVGYKLVIAGDNQSDYKYVDYLHKLAVGNKNIIFTGGVYGDDKETLLKHAYMFCLPSTIEGLSISLLEAMSFKLPIIASDIPANHEVLAKDKALWVQAENISDLESAILHAVTNSSKIYRSVDFNYNLVVDNYTWACVTKKYINHIYKL